MGKLLQFSNSWTTETKKAPLAGRFWNTHTKASRMSDFTLPLETLKINGLLRLIVDDLLSKGSENKNIALGSALALIAGCAQRAFIFPDENFPNLYVMLIAPPGSGKDMFLERPKAYFRTVSKRLVARDARSSEAMKKMIEKNKSQVFVIDEILKKFAPAWDDRPSGVAYEKATLLLELYSNRAVIEGNETKGPDGCLPDTDDARVTLLGAGTEQAMRNLIGKPNYSDDGFMSRCSIFADSGGRIKSPSFLRPGEVKNKRELNSEIVDSLRRIFWGFPNIFESDGEYDGLEPPNANKHIWYSEEASAAIIAQDEAFNLRFDYMSSNDQKGSGRAFITRHMERTRKFSMLHAIGCFRTVVEMEDVIFALELSMMMLDRDLEIFNIENRSADSKALQAIEDFVREQNGYPVSKRDIMRGAGGHVRNLTAAQVGLLLATLVDAGTICCYESGRMKQAFVIADPTVARVRSIR